MKILFLSIVSTFVFSCEMANNRSLANKTMNELSTQNLTFLPSPKILKSLCKSISTLEAIISPEWEYRYYSYYKNWSEKEELFEMKDGQGNQMLILFSNKGVIINGFAHESTMKNWKGVKEGIPNEFNEFIYGEPIQSIGTTFCIWKTDTDKEWQIGNIDFPNNSYLDGSIELLKLFDGKPKSYKTWATEYYELDKLSIELVQKVYDNELMTNELINKINPDLKDLNKLKSELSEIGYKYKD